MDAQKKLKKNVDGLLAERKMLREQLEEATKQLKQRNDKAAAAEMLALKNAELAQRLSEVTQERAAARSEAASAHALADDALSKLHAAQLQLQTEKQATELLDKEIVRLKQQLTYENAEGLTQTRRRLKERGEELETVRRILRVAESQLMEKDNLITKLQRDAKLHVRPSPATGPEQSDPEYETVSTLDQNVNDP